MKKDVLKYYSVLGALVFLIAGCGSNTKKLNERLTLWRNDKIPYGTFYAYENLSSVFPDASIVVNKRSPDRFRGLNFGESADALIPSEGSSVHIIISPQVLPDEKEMRAPFNYIGEGNHIFISSFNIPHPAWGYEVWSVFCKLEILNHRPRCVVENGPVNPRCPEFFHESFCVHLFQTSP